MGLCYRAYIWYIETKQRVVYEEISSVKDSVHVPFLLIGDFNQVLHISERKGMTRSTGGMRLLTDWLNECSLLDLPL